VNILIVSLLTNSEPNTLCARSRTLIDALRGNKRLRFHCQRALCPTYLQASVLTNDLPTQTEVRVISSDLAVSYSAEWRRACPLVVLWAVSATAPNSYNHAYGAEGTALGAIVRGSVPVWVRLSRPEA
jgi:hypothetical protein